MMDVTVNKPSPIRRVTDATYTPVVSQQVLEQHGAKMLDPSRVEVAGGYPPPRSTLYRSGVLLIADKLLGDKDFNPVTTVLAEHGLELVNRRDRRSKAMTANEDPDLPRAVELRASATADVPAQVDAWSALQLLRAATRRTDLNVMRKVVDQIGLDHVLLSGHVGTLDGAPNEGSGLPSEELGGWRRGPSRSPVAYVGAAPWRNEISAGALPRRPVVAVLDTGIGQHPWLGTAGGTDPAKGSFVHTWPGLQALILDAQIAAGTPEGEHIRDVWEATDSSRPLVGSLDSDTGHGTFIAGLIRQAAPDADVLAIRVMRGTGIADESDVLLALTEIADRVSAAQNAKDPAMMIDIVSISLGCFLEADDSDYALSLKDVVTRLANQGVLVVAAAGNHPTTRPWYPAAYAADLAGQVPVQVCSVGALNQSSSKALFSAEGEWVNCFATGVDLVSTVPTNIQGSRTSGIQVVARNRAAPDPDDYRMGFARWSGTSFATPLVAATLANALIKVAATPPGKTGAISLTMVDETTTIKRAQSALADVLT